VYEASQWYWTVSSVVVLLPHAVVGTPPVSADPHR
jgi:hypothetical protein